MLRYVSLHMSYYISGDCPSMSRDRLVSCRTKIYYIKRICHNLYYVSACGFLIPDCGLMHSDIYFNEYSWFRNCACFGIRMVPSPEAHLDRESSW